METQVRKRAGAVRWTHAAPGADGDGEAAEASETTGATTLPPLQELVGAMFSSPKELRHLAERELGELFVPVELLAESEHRAVFTLHPGSLAPLLVHAERARHWFPYRVVRVEASTADARGRAGEASDTDGPAGRPRLPYLYGEPRPAIDWL